MTTLVDTNLSRLSGVILSSLEQFGEQTGYTFMKKTKGFWVASHQQIYRELNKLHGRGLVSLREEAQEDRPDRRCFTITGKGLAELSKYRGRDLQYDDSVTRSDAMSQIIAAKPGPDVEKMINRYLSTLNEFKEQYQTSRDAYKLDLADNPDCVITQNLAIHFSRQYHAVRSEINFLNEVINYKG